MARNYELSKFLTGMRGYAALGVFLIHIGGMGLRETSSLGNKVVDVGKYGVVVFFVLSAFTIGMSIHNQGEKFNYKFYLIQRFFRIAPLYYLILIIASLTGGSDYYETIFKVSNDYFSFFLHITFLNLFLYKYQNNLIGVEWTIPVEFFFYLILPVIYFYLLGKLYRIVHVLILSFFISFSFNFFYDYYINPSYNDIAYHWSIFKYAFMFMVGICLYCVYPDFPKIKHSAYWHSLSVILLLIVLLVYIHLSFDHLDYVVTLWTALLIVFNSYRSIVTRVIFENPVIMFLGKISYSVYLNHFLIIKLLGNGYDIFHDLLCLTITIAVSAVSFYLIERPFITFGKKLTINKNYDSINEKCFFKRV